MSIENVLERIAASLEKMTEQLPAGAAAAPPGPASAPAASGKKGKKQSPQGEKTPSKTIDDLRDLGVKVTNELEGGKQEVLDLLARFGCKRLADLKPSQYDEFYTELEEIYNEAEGDEGDDF